MPFYCIGQCLLVLLPEIAALPIFAISIYGMNRGVEIGHPVYSLLFANLIFPLATTFIILFASFAININHWKAISSVVNMITMLYHHSSWAILSVLRFWLITKPDWVHSKWPDPTNLRNLALGSVALAFTLVVAAILGYFIPSAMAYGWPGIDFFSAVPDSAKAKIVAVTALIFHVPVFVSCYFYILLLRTVKRSTKVGAVDSNMPSNLDDDGIYVGSDNESTLENQSRTFKSSEQRNRSERDLRHISLKRFVKFGRSKDLESQQRQDLMLEKELERQRSIAKNRDELSASMKSIQTNLLVILVGIVASILTKQLPTDQQRVFNLASNSVQKTLLPIVTTLANFGLVRKVSVAFCKWMWNR
jgi:hypothetical protein